MICISLIISDVEHLFMFFFNDTATTEIYTLSLHDALPISPPSVQEGSLFSPPSPAFIVCRFFDDGHSDWREVIPHCSFDVHFSND